MVIQCPHCDISGILIRVRRIKTAPCPECGEDLFWLYWGESSSDCEANPNKEEVLFQDNLFTTNF